MALSSTTFYYRLVHADFDKLASTDFRIAVVDDDDAHLHRNEIAALNAEGKTLWAYVSTCEAESYRPYWRDGDWGNHRPDFLIAPNADWPASWRVAFWEPDWQRTVLDRVETLVRTGYGGAYFDVVDTTAIPEVRAAYALAHPQGDIRTEAVAFIERIAAHARALNPDFRIVIQNGVGLLSEREITDLTAPLTPNARLLSVIDGVGKESTFTLGDQFPLGWTEWDARYLENAIGAGKFVIGIEYPTTHAAQAYALQHMLEAGYIPYLDTRMTGAPLPHNEYVSAMVSPERIAHAAGDPGRGTPLLGTDGPDRLEGGPYNDIVRSFAGDDILIGGEGADIFVYDNGGGHDTILDFLQGTDRIALYGFPEDADIARDVMPLIHYEGGHAEILFSPNHTLTLQHIDPGTLVADDFFFGW